MKWQRLITARIEAMLVTLRATVTASPILYLLSLVVLARIVRGKIDLIP